MKLIQLPEPQTPVFFCLKQQSNLNQNLNPLDKVKPDFIKKSGQSKGYTFTRPIIRYFLFLQALILFFFNTYFFSHYLPSTHQFSFHKGEGLTPDLVNKNIKLVRISVSKILPKRKNSTRAFNKGSCPRIQLLNFIQRRVLRNAIPNMRLQGFFQHFGNVRKMDSLL